MDFAGEHGWPLFIKPARGGSSMGITKVDELSGLDEAIEEARRHDPKFLVESLLRGREIECGVLEFEDGPRASVPAEIPPVTAHEFYDFEAKYIDSAAGLVPAPLTAEQTAEVQRLAVAAFDATSCEGLVRADFFLTEDGDLRHQRDQHPAGLHPDLHVPAHVAGERRELPGAGRPADPGRADPLHRTALRDPEGRDGGGRPGLPGVGQAVFVDGGAPQRSTIAPSARGEHGAGAEKPAARPTRGTGRGSEVDDRTGQGARDAVHLLHFGDHHAAECIDRVGLGPHDHVVRTGDVLCLDDSRNLGDGLGDDRRLAHLGLDEDVRLYHGTSRAATRIMWGKGTPRYRVAEGDGETYGPCDVHSVACGVRKLTYPLTVQTALSTVPTAVTARDRGPGRVSGAINER